jgi:hypothetical protein
MSATRKSIQVFDHERALLVELYMKWRIPVDSFDGFPDEKATFAEEWRTMSSRTDSADDLVHYMMVQRKRGLWVKLGDDYRRLPPLPAFTADETEALVGIYHERVTILENGSDVLSFESETKDLIARDFQEETGRFIEPHLLVMKITALRKRGLLPKVGNRGQDKQNRGFDDIDKAIG